MYTDTDLWWRKVWKEHYHEQYKTSYEKFAEEFEKNTAEVIYPKSNDTNTTLNNKSDFENQAPIKRNFYKSQQYLGSMGYCLQRLEKSVSNSEKNEKYEPCY